MEVQVVLDFSQLVGVAPVLHLVLRAHAQSELFRKQTRWSAPPA